ncbi:hypothetical protein [Afipia clevelandensis]|uniref:Uncharacterized protein n=1 Tax=Afipia clevelandensis ATCC 49720 TaxID=883079 RepID=K8NZ06_9BRAD|nr:hypothetical protein [Afipia clevelandensis]EKS33699.1 hypothetical protein HMPREF9696_02819 [Afipia clevelandensis ATCC 49720]
MIGFPLLLIPFAIYNIFVFLMPGVAFTAPVTTVSLMSGVQWTPTFGDALLALTAALLMFEVIKAARPGARYLTDHLLSLLASGAAVAEFLLLPQFGTSTFFLLAVLMVVEFLAGVSIGFRNRHRRVPVAVAADVPAPTPAAMSPAPVTTAPVNPVPAEPTFDHMPQDAKPVEPVFPPPQSTPAPEVAPKPVPTLAVVRSSDSMTPAPERKLSDWTVSDLVSDHAPDNAAGPQPKP